MYGNDATAALLPYTLPFLTITAALTFALPGQEVFIYPGIYNESITVPVGVALRGANSLNTIIQQINPTISTTVVKLSQNTRLEDLTINISLASTSDPIGPYVAVEVLTGASINTKIRTCNISASLLSGSTNIYGILSSGISNLGVTISHTVRSTSINVIATGTGLARGIYINGSNRFIIRDVIVFCTGTGTNLVGCEVNDLSGLCVLSIRTSTINGLKADLLQTSGFIYTGTTDLINHTAPQSFNVDIQPSYTYFGFIGFPGGNLTYYLPPSVIPIASVSVTTPYQFKFITTTLLISISIGYSGSIALGESVTFSIYKNGVLTGLTATLTSVSGTFLTVTNVGVTVLPTDFIDVRLTTVGSPNASEFTGILLTY